jgi:nucleoid-associated protein YgaU
MNDAGHDDPSLPQIELAAMDSTPANNTRRHVSGRSEAEAAAGEASEAQEASAAAEEEEEKEEEEAAAAAAEEEEAGGGGRT